MNRFVLVLILSIITSTCGVCYAKELPDVSAKSAIVMDAYSGRVLFSKSPDIKLGMASTTKIMTAIVALDKGNLDDYIKTSRNAAYVEGSSIYLEENETIKLSDAIYGLMLNSGNDAAIAIAEHIGGNIEGFTNLMNQEAKEIGAINTNFMNPHGLDHKEHYTTAYDLALITRYGLNKVMFSDIVRTKEKKIPWENHTYNRLLKNHNKLLWKYQYCDGVKTGFTKKTGRCLVSSATKDNMRLIAVTLNAGNDWDDHIKMYEYCFQKFKPDMIFEKNQFVKTLLVKNGKKNNIGLVTEDKFQIPVELNENNIVIKYVGPEFIKAPVSRNMTIGKMEAYINGIKVAEVNLKPSVYVEEQNIIMDFSKVIKNWIMLFLGNVY